MVDFLGLEYHYSLTAVKAYLNQEKQVKVEAEDKEKGRENNQMERQ